MTQETKATEKLKKLIDLLEKAGDLLNLEDGWDDENGKRVDFDSHIYAIGLIHIVLNNVVPDINPCCDGTLDLSWRAEGVKLLVNVKGDQVAFYGDSKAGYIKANRIAIEDAIPQIRRFTRAHL